MKIAIIGGKLEYYNLLDQKLNELIKEKEIYLFYILCGAPSYDMKPSNTLGKIWAERNGAPIQWIFEPDPALMIKKLFNQVDYIIFFYNGSLKIRQLIMQYKLTGKHGSVINI